ncbi:hypothetical protein GA0061105_11033 [Rhizobium aethiopicum]|uniref:DUF1993 domain-containing protein n=1 Tax=Rhizobium aethiopicum TaxID=1138170 RepID=A0A1C3Y783_9HYPH|nr:hypothetical protein GA0061105_11033 [Rhizobium aethiopicum]
MSISIYRLTVPMFQRGLASLRTYLDKAEAYAKEKNIDPAILVSARLAPDMLPLAGQYQRASDSAKFTLARLTATDAPKFEDNETTIEQLRERLAKTDAYLAGISAQALEGAESRQITLPGRSGIVLPGDEYVATFALPNFYFHVATARHPAQPGRTDRQARLSRLIQSGKNKGSFVVIRRRRKMLYRGRRVTGPVSVNSV